MPTDLKEPTNLLVTQKLLTKSNAHTLSYIYEDILNPLFFQFPSMKEKYNKLSTLDSKSMFSQVFLPEMFELGALLFPRTYNLDFVAKQIDEFLDFLHVIGEKEDDEEVPLSFKNQFFSVAIIIVARPDTLIRLGRAPYIARVNEKLTQGFKNIYVSARGRKREEVKKIGQHFEGHQKVTGVSYRQGLVHFSDGRNPKMNLFAVIRTGKVSSEGERSINSA